MRDLPFNYKNNCEILYPAINQLKKFPKKEKIIIFTGKLNTSKGYDIFGKAVLKILNKFKDWKAFAIGNERRETHNFKHKNFKVIDWLPHKKILNFTKKALYLLLVLDGRNLLEELQWNQLLMDVLQLPLIEVG